MKSLTNDRAQCREMVDAIRLIMGQDPLYRARPRSVYGVPVSLGCLVGVMQDGIRITRKDRNAEYRDAEVQRLSVAAYRHNAAQPKMIRMKVSA